MEVRHLLETRDAIAREVAKATNAKNPVELRVSATTSQTAVEKNRLSGLRMMAESAMEWAALTLPVTDVVLWKPSLFDAATYKRGEVAGLRIALDLLPVNPQFWMLDRSDGNSRVWADLERDVYEATTDGAIPVPVRLEGIFLGCMPWAAFTMNGERAPEKVERVFLEKGILTPADLGREQAPVCPMVFVYRGRQNDPKAGHKTLYYHYAEFVANKGVVGAALYTTVMYCALQFMQEQFVCRQLIGRDRRNGKKFRFPDRPQHRSAVERLVLRERVILPIDAPQAPTGAQKAPVEHDCCWLQRPHTRRLRQPRKKDGALIVPVRSCIKGDRSKPMLPPRDRVIQVVR